MTPAAAKAIAVDVEPSRAPNTTDPAAWPTARAMNNATVPSAARSATDRTAHTMSTPLIAM